MSWTRPPRGGTSANDLRDAARGRDILRIGSVGLSKRGSKMTMLLFLMMMMLEAKAGADQRMEPASYWVQFLQQFAPDTFPRLLPRYPFPSPDSNPISADVAWT